jgi:hypothetical protein
MLTPFQHLTEFTGSIFETIGTFLLAVEAIKLENLKSVREGLINRIIHHLSPRIMVADSDSPESVQTKTEKAMNRVFFLIFLAGLALEVAILNGSIWEMWRSVVMGMPGPQALKVLMGSSLMIILVFSVGYWIGAILYMIAITPFRVLYRTLEWIDKNTVKGTTGILGFLVFLVGTILHAYISLTSD